MIANRTAGEIGEGQPLKTALAFAVGAPFWIAREPAVARRLRTAAVFVVEMRALIVPGCVMAERSLIVMAFAVAALWWIAPGFVGARRKKTVQGFVREVLLLIVRGFVVVGR